MISNRASKWQLHSVVQSDRLALKLRNSLIGLIPAVSQQSEAMCYSKQAVSKHSGQCLVLQHPEPLQLHWGRVRSRACLLGERISRAYAALPFIYMTGTRCPLTHLREALAIGGRRCSNTRPRHGWVPSRLCSALVTPGRRNQPLVGFPCWFSVLTQTGGVKSHSSCFTLQQAFVSCQYMDKQGTRQKEGIYWGLFSAIVEEMDLNK